MDKDREKTVDGMIVEEITMKDQFQYLVSVIIPVYNAQKFLPKAVQSVLQQTLSQDQIEILLIDDGSKDKSPEMCDHYTVKHGNVRVIHQKNAGVSAARNRGIQEARGKYLAYLDADDWLSEEALQNVTEFFDEHYDEIDVAGYSTVFCYPKGKKSRHVRDEIIQESGIIDCDNKEFVTLTRLTVLVKNRWGENEQFSTALTFHEDTDYLLRVVAEQRRFGYVKEAVYYYRQDTGGATSTVSNPEHIFSPSMRMYRQWLVLAENRDSLNHYVQNCILGDFAWKLRENKLLPNHLSGQSYINGLKQIQDLLSHIESYRIMDHPNLDFRDRFFLLALKRAGDEELPSGDAIFLSGMQRKNGKCFVMGMLPGNPMEYRNMELYICTKSDIKIPMRLREFSWGKKYKGILPEAFTGFCETVSAESQEPLKFVLSGRENDCQLRCCYGPDAFHKGHRHSSVKKRLIGCIARAEKHLLPRIALYYQCPEQFLQDNNKRDGMKRIYVVQREEQIPQGIDEKQIVRFRSRKHRALFLAATQVVLSSPAENYIPIYERTYLSLKDQLCHKITVAENPK